MALFRDKLPGFPCTNLQTSVACGLDLLKEIVHVVFAEFACWMAERSSFGFGERVLRVFPKRVGPGNGVGSSVRECLTTTNPMFSFVSCKTWTLTRQCSNRSALSTARCACWELHQIVPLCSKNENCSWS